VDTPAGPKRAFVAQVVRISVPDPAERDRLLTALGEGATAEGRAVVRIDLGAGLDLVATLQRLRDLGVPDTALTVAAPTLEDVFLRVTGAALARESSDPNAAGVAAIQRSLATPGRGR